MKRLLSASVLLTLLLATSGCGSRSAERSAEGGDTLTERAQYLTLVDHGCYVTAEIADPWNEGRLLASYVLVDRDKELPDGVGDRSTVIRVPLERSVVYSSTNMGAIAELDALPAVVAVADGSYYAPGDTVTRMIAEGRLRDVGNSMSPDPEAIIDLDPDALLVSPYENAGHGVLDRLGVAVIDCADYMETHPLARAEWLLLLGELYGRREEAAEIYDDVCARYQALCDSVTASAAPRPKVLTETVTSGVWYVPGGRSYMANMLTDAGADYPWADDTSTGSLQLDIASVIDKASDADVWIMRTYGPLSGKAALRDISSLNERFKAYATGELYNCDTSVSPIFNDIAFHPERVLRDYILIFQPGLLDGGEGMKYYRKIGQ